MRFATEWLRQTTPQQVGRWQGMAPVASEPDFSVQAIDFIGFLSAFFVIVLSQTRMNRCIGAPTQQFCTKLST